MTSPRRVALLALLVALLIGGCNSDGSDGDVPSAPADATVQMKPGSTDLNALDLRDKLIVLPGVAGVVYDQPDQRLRIDFSADATQTQRITALDTARADPAVSSADDDGAGPGRTPPPPKAPAPGGTSGGSSVASTPSPT